MKRYIRAEISNLSDESCDSKIKLAKNPNIPARVLSRLAKDPTAQIRCAVAGNPSTSVADLRQLSTDAIPYVRVAVANNKNTPMDVIEHMAYNDKAYTVRYAIVQRTDISSDLLENLSTDDDPLVREAIADNINTPKSYIEWYAKNDPHPDVRKAAKIHLRELRLWSN